MGTSLSRVLAELNRQKAMRPPPVNPLIPDIRTLSHRDQIKILNKCDSLMGFTRFWWPLVEPERAFQPGWHLECVAEHLEDAMKADGHTKNIIINVPPRCAKSLQTCVFWPAYQWTKAPSARWMFASFAGDLVERDSRKRKDIIKHPLYSGLWDVRIRRDQDNVLRFTNQHQGFHYAVTVAGQGMGEGADFLVTDDPINPRRALSTVERAKVIHWYRTTFSRRSNDERTVRRVIIMQRLHESDLTGYLVAEALGYDHLVLPMRYEPRRYLFMHDAGLDKAAVSDAAKAAAFLMAPPEDETPPAPAEPAVVVPDSLEDAAGFTAALDALRKAAVAAKPRDSISLTRLQQLHPKPWVDRFKRKHIGLVDGPEGSGRENAGDLLWPERFDEATVAQAEQELGPDAPGQYQQRPSAESGDIFQREYFRRWEPKWEVVEDKATGVPKSVFAGVVLHGPADGQVREFKAEQLTWFQTIDTALTEGRRSAYTAVATCFATPEFDLGIWHVFRGRMGVQYQYDAIVAIRKGPIHWHQKTHTITPGPSWPFRVAIQAVESKASGIGLIQTAASLGAPLHPLIADGDKVARAVPVASMYTNGKVYHPPPSKPWVVELEDELMLFPNGTFKDQADVVAYAGLLITRDKIIRGMCSSRVMAEGDCPTCDGKGQVEKRNAETDELEGYVPCPLCHGEWDTAREAEAREAGNLFEIDTGSGRVKIDFPDDEESPFGSMFGANWRT